MDRLADISLFLSHCGQSETTSVFTSIQNNQAGVDVFLGDGQGGIFNVADSPFTALYDGTYIDDAAINAISSAVVSRFITEFGSKTLAIKRKYLGDDVEAHNMYDRTKELPLSGIKEAYLDFGDRRALVNGIAEKLSMNRPENIDEGQWADIVGKIRKGVNSGLLAYSAMGHTIAETLGKYRDTHFDNEGFEEFYANNMGLVTSLLGDLGDLRAHEMVGELYKAMGRGQGTNAKQRIADTLKFVDDWGVASLEDSRGDMKVDSDF